MSHFYGVLSGSRGRATRCATKKSGIATTAASWSGCVKVYLFHDEKTGADMFQVTQEKWQGHGTHEVIVEGIVGQPIVKVDGRCANCGHIRNDHGIKSGACKEYTDAPLTIKR